MKSCSTSSDSSSDDEALIVLKSHKNAQNEEKIEDPNEYSNLLVQDWQQCEFCDEVFANRYSLIRHNISHIIIPLIKQHSHQCHECDHHFLTIEDLNVHISKHHKNTSDQEEILQSIIKNEVLVKCEDDLKEVLVKHNEYKNMINSDYCIKEESIDSSNIDNVDEDTNNDDQTSSDAKDLQNLEGIKTTEVTNNLWTLTSDCDIKSEVTEETTPIIFERSSSPLDEDKESIRQRLLFEEDVEDTLIKDLSIDYQVNIETLCKEVTLDFDDAILEDDNTLTLHSKDGTDIQNGISTQQQMFDYGTNCFGNVTNNFESESKNFNTAIEFGKRISNFENGMSKFGNRTNILVPVTNSYTFGTNNSANGMVNNKEIISSEVIDVDFYGESIHFDLLMLPDISICRICKQKFPNRLLLIQHEKEHLIIRKDIRGRSLLCPYCERYIIGNYHKLRSHKEKAHPEKDIEKQLNTQSCPKCKLKYYNYEKHLKNYHEHYFCKTCNRGYDTLVEKNKHDCSKPDLKISFNTPNPKMSFNKPNPNFMNKINVESKIMKLCDLCYSFMKVHIKNRHNYEEVGAKSEFGVRQVCDKCNNLCFSVKLLKRRSVQRVEENRKGFEVRSRAKPMSNMKRLLKIQNRLKLMKLINK